MCTAVIEVPNSSERSVRVLAVRDEDPRRPWDGPGTWWPTLPDVIGVRDRLAGGAWLATSARAGRLALVLNRAELDHGSGAKAPRSRGAIVLETVAGLPLANPPETAGFNLLTVADGKAFVTRWDGESVRRSQLEPGVHMIAHHDVDDTIQTPRIARWLSEFRQLAGLDDGAWQERWLALLEESARLPADDDRAIIRDNRALGYETLSLLVCLAEVRQSAESGSEVDLDSAVLHRPAAWDQPDFRRVSI